MVPALQEPSPDVAAWEDTPALSQHLRRVLEEAEQALAPRQEPPRPTPATMRVPRPFAYD